MKEIKAPNPVDQSVIMDEITVFLAGSIEMGTAEDWQVKVKEALDDVDVTLFNPRRDDWDWTWEQSINNPNFKEQVLWEQDRIQDARLVFFYFDPNTKSPISLMELGLVAGDSILGPPAIVVCPDGFWRKGNVEITCERYGFPIFNTLQEGIDALKMTIVNANI